MTTRHSKWFAILLASASVSGRAGSQDASPPVDFARYAARRDRAYAKLGSDLLVIQSRWAQAPAAQAGFDQDATFYYFTGADHVTGAVLVLDGATRRAEMFLPKAAPLGQGLPSGDARVAAERASALHVDGAAGWSAFPAYVEQRLAANPRLVMHVDDGGIEASFAGRLGTPLDSLATLANPQAAWREALRRRWPNATIVVDTTISPALRVVKDSAEIAILRRVGANSAAAFRAGLPRFVPGHRQREVEAAVVESCVKSGDGPSFWPWAMSGPTAAFPAPFASSLDLHYLDRVMRAGEIVRYDLGCKVDRYVGDVGRTLPVSGKFTPEQAEVVDLLVAVYRAGLNTLRDGAAGHGLLRASVAEARRLRGAMRTPLGRHAAALMATPDSLPYWQWHGIGLDFAEPLPAVLRAGMVLDYEPILVVDGLGFYMEDMVLVTPTGYEMLTAGLPSTAAEIERAMRRPRQ